MAVEQEHRSQRAHRRADPEGSIDYQVDGAAHLAGNELIDSRIDRGVLSSDPATREETENGKAQKIPGECARDRGQ